jgi:hypothetical protein
MRWLSLERIGYATEILEHNISISAEATVFKIDENGFKGY